MKYVATPSSLVDLLRDRDSFFVIGHIEPDGDCICSALALCHFLHRIGKTAIPINEGPFDRREIAEFKDYFESEITEELWNEHRDAAVVVVDCSTLDRIGRIGGQLRDMPVAVIDHHTAGEDFGDIQFINPTAPATSLLIQQVIEDLGESPDAEESELIFFAFATDTGFFRHIDQDSALSFEYVSRLVAAGASPKYMYQRITGGKTLESKKHLGFLLQKADLVADSRAIIVTETAEETARFGRQNRDSDGFYQHMLSVDGVEAVAILRENEDGNITGGLRSKRVLDVGKLAQEFGGGGHQRAAGFSTPGDLHKIRQELTARLTQLLG